jgi:hypothetical protein
MPDPRLERFYFEAQIRGWQPDWHESHDRTELVFNPTLTSLDPAHPINDDLSGQFCIGLGVAIGGAITCWVKQGLSDSFICPWGEGDVENMLLDALPPDQELTRFPVVNSLEEGLALFDAAVARWMAEMRQFVRESPDPDTHAQINDWASPAPLSAR